MTDATFDALTESGLVAIIRKGDPDTLIETIDALVAGGVTAIELTADTPDVTDLITEINGSFDEVVVGAGTVLDAQTARNCLVSGAEFLVSPSLHPAVIDTANRNGALVAAGVMTPTEVIQGWEAGADLLKVFPASTVGPGHLAALEGPFGDLPLLPTGGIDLDNVAAFIEAGAVCVGVGSSLIDDETIERGDFETITARARNSLAEIDAARE